MPPGPSVKAGNFFLFPPRPTSVDAGLDGSILGSCSRVSDHSVDGSNPFVEDGFFVGVC